MDNKINFSGWEFHKFEINGRYMLYDANSAQYFSIDKASYRVLDYLKTHSVNEIINILSDEFSREEIIDVFEELEGYQKKGLIFNTKRKLPSIKTMDLNPLSKLTINVANDCNLRCKYCWNLYGTYGDKPHLMDKNTAIRAVDFLFKISGDNKYLNIDYYGGEPLLNFDILKACTEYAIEKARVKNKEITFSIETNGTFLEDEIIGYFEEKNFQISISIDGEKDYHDKVRKEKDGRGTWNKIISIAQKILKNKKIGLAIRATLITPNTNLWDTVQYLYKIGLEDVQVEYAGELRASRNDEQRRGHLECVDIEKERKEYIRYAKGYLDSVLCKSSRGWFDRKILKIYHNTPNLKGCSVGRGDQMAIDAYGNIYPCLVFTGKKEYILGNVTNHYLRTDIFNTLQKNRVDKREGCKDCWARFLCGGGCVAVSAWYCNDISIPDMTSCNRMKYEFETAMWLISELQEKAADFFHDYFNHSNLLEEEICRRYSNSIRGYS
jgi:uncharacterized protein